MPCPPFASVSDENADASKDDSDRRISVEILCNIREIVRPRDNEASRVAFEPFPDLARYQPPPCSKASSHPGEFLQGTLLSLQIW